MMLKPAKLIAALTFMAAATPALAQSALRSDYLLAENEPEELAASSVISSRIPVTLQNSARVVTVISSREIAQAPVQSVNDILKYAAGVDVRQRGAFGMQTDISVRGGTYDQIAILINGVNISSPNTGHNVSGFPVDVADIERIEIIEGPAGRSIGTSSLKGAINIVTKDYHASRGQNGGKVGGSVQLEGGSYGLYGGGASLHYADSGFSSLLSTSFRSCDGAVESSDFKNGKIYYKGDYQAERYRVSGQFGMDEKAFGANTFYSAKFPNQFEALNNMFFSLKADTYGTLHLTPMFYATRQTDRFELIRGDESQVPFNHHNTHVFGTSVSGYFSSPVGKTAFGAEMRLEDIISTTLGTALPQENVTPIPGVSRDYTRGTSRANLNLHAEHNIELGPARLSAGLLAVYNTGLDHRFHIYPGADLSIAAGLHNKLFVSWNTSMRMPTFTELYYTSNATHQGNSNLKQEEMQAFELGWKYSSAPVQTTLSLFHHRGSNMIDWVMAKNETIWRSVNHTKVNTTGIEADMVFNLHEIFGESQPFSRLLLNYAYNIQESEQQEGFTSENILDYNRHKFIASLTHGLGLKGLAASWSFRYQDRIGSYDEFVKVGNVIEKGEHRDYQPYSLLDLKINYGASRRWSFFAEFNNIADVHYLDYGNVPQPGFTFRAGVVYSL